MSNYISIIFDDLSNKDNYMIIYKEKNGFRSFPMVLPKSAYYYLKKINNDNNKEQFLVDIVYKLEKPKELILEKRESSYSSYYISQFDNIRKLNLLDIFVISIRYNMPISLNKSFIKDKKSDEEIFINNMPIKVDLYRLNKIIEIEH